MSGDGIIAKIRRQPAMLRLWSERTLHLLGADSVPEGAPAALDIRINDFDHIERFEQTVPWLARETFIAANRRRIAGGALVFTLADAAGPLLAYGFAHPDAKQTKYTHVDQRVVWAARTATIYGGFVHPAARGRGVHAEMQTARIRHLIGELGMRWVVSAVASDNERALRSANKTSLRPFAEMRTRIRLGRTAKTVVRREPGFECTSLDAA